MVGGFLIMGFGVVVQLITLPVELDASFRKALPVLEAGYLETTQVPAARRSCVRPPGPVAASLASLLNFWRWIWRSCGVDLRIIGTSRAMPGVLCQSAREIAERRAVITAESAEVEVPAGERAAGDACPSRSCASSSRRARDRRASAGNAAA